MYLFSFRKLSDNHIFVSTRHIFSGFISLFIKLNKKEDSNKL